MSEVFPKLSVRHFSTDGELWCDVVVRDASGEAIYTSNREAPSPDRPPDAAIGILVLRPRPDSPAAAPPFAAPMRGPGPGPSPERPQSGPRWTVELRHRGGPLDAIVRRSRARNLSVSALVLVLLAASSALLVTSARRSETIARQQMEFIASVTHELNTPIAAVTSAGQNLADGIVSGEDHLRRYGTMIVREGRRLATTVVQILEFAGIQRGERRLDMRPSDVTAIIDTAVADLAWLIEEHGVTVERSIAERLPQIEADPPELARALQNLLTNAIKYGGATKWVGILARHDAARHEIVVDVRDRGLGIERHELSEIFEPFFRGRSALRAGARGTGLGLSIVKDIVEAHGGSVSADSSAGKGSVFSIRLPEGTKR